MKNLPVVKTITPQITLEIVHKITNKEIIVTSEKNMYFILNRVKLESLKVAALLAIGNPAN